MITDFDGGYFVQTFHSFAHFVLWRCRSFSGLGDACSLVDRLAFNHDAVGEGGMFAQVAAALAVRLSCLFQFFGAFVGT